MRPLSLCMLLHVMCCSTSPARPLIHDSKSTTVNANEGPDPRFHIEPRTTTQPLNDRPTNMNIIYFLTLLALDNYEGDIDRSIRVSKSPWTNVRIDLGLLGRPTIPRRYVIWGLGSGLRHMIDHGFYNTDFFLYYDQEQVGVIQMYGPSSRHQAGIGLEMDTVNTLDRDLPQNLSLGSAFYKVSYLSRAEAMSPSGIFSNMADSLMVLAALDKDMPCPNFSIESVEFDTGLIYEKSDLGLQRTLLSRVKDAARCVWVTAQYLTMHLKYAEYTTEYKSNDEELGQLRGVRLSGLSKIGRSSSEPA